MMPRFRLPLKWQWPLLVFLFVVAMQLWLVSWAGSDLPFDDQWDAEGWALYPKWQDGTLRIGDLFQAHNEHRIFWTRLLDLALFKANGQWDPLVQLVAGAVLRGAAAAAIVFGFVARSWSGWNGASVALLIAVAFLPHLAWNNVLWGFQTQIYFSVLFSVIALWFLGQERLTNAGLTAGVAAALAAQLAMSSGAFVPLTLLMLVGLRIGERRKLVHQDVVLGIAASALLAVALIMRTVVKGHAVLQAPSAAIFADVLIEILAWPHDPQLLAAIVLNAPLFLAVAGRLTGRRAAKPGEDFALLIGGWALAGALAVAWFRGGGPDFFFGVPSRYVDFFVLLPIANTWCIFVLVGETAVRHQKKLRLGAIAWTAFLFIGWAGLSAQTIRQDILPRCHDHVSPIHLTLAFQRTNDDRLFAPDSRVTLPHPSPQSVRRVLNDPRMLGLLPPSLQPQQPMGPLSTAVRWLLRRQ